MFARKAEKRREATNVRGCVCVRGLRCEHGRGSGRVHGLECEYGNECAQERCRSERVHRFVYGLAPKGKPAREGERGFAHERCALGQLTQWSGLRQPLLARAWSWAVALA